MAPRRVVKTINNTKLKDVICPICRSILIEPITLPCQHSFCATCFHLTTPIFTGSSDTSTSYDRVNLCPLCCIRIGSWLRTANKSKKLINEQLWQTIQQQFPLQVQTKLETVHQNYKKHCKQQQQQQDFQMNSTKAKRNLMDLNDNNNNNKKNNKITTKEYTCRILCEKIETNLDDGHRINRSNSIESECLYFKPIDYRHNPPSTLLSTTITTTENQQPIKVPTQRPTLNNRNIKIIAPCGQNRLNLDPIQSAFAYYFLFTTNNNNNNNSDSNNDDDNNNNNNNNNKTVKRGNKRKLRIDNSNGNDMVATLKRSLRSNSRHHCLELQKKKRLEQERSDFELAIKLQEAYNQYRYKTRSCTVTTI